MWDTAVFIIKLIALAYFVSGLLFYLFFKSLLKNSGDEHQTISIRSWHYKLAYPFKKFNGVVVKQVSFFSYFSKIFFTTLLGWPILIAWQTAKMTVYLPFLALFGRYALPGFETMSSNENPLVLEIKRFYLPTVGNGIPILPIYFAATAGYGWLIYNWPGMTLGITLFICIVLSLMIGFFYLNDKGYFDRIKEENKAFGARLEKLTEKFNYKLKVWDGAEEENDKDD